MLAQTGSRARRILNERLIKSEGLDHVSRTVKRSFHILRTIRGHFTFYQKKRVFFLTCYRFILVF